MQEVVCRANTDLQMSSSSGHLCGHHAKILRELNIVESQNALAINLNYNHLTFVPDVLLDNQYCQCKLQSLYLKRNCITSLPTSLDRLKALTTLYLEANALTELPHAVALLPSLSQLNVSGNNITTVTPSLGTMQSLRDLNISCNSITALPKQLWEAPSLQTLNVADNQVSILSPEVIQCQTLTRLTFDSNKLATLPIQLFMLKNLQQVSFCGNQLLYLPNMATKSELKRIYVDRNPALKMIPESLLFSQELGVFECDVKVANDEMDKVVTIHTCHSSVPPLLELVGRSLHSFVRDEHTHDPSIECVRWLPEQLCQLLRLPLALTEWMVPTGLCSQCRRAYFKYYYVNRLSLFLFKEHCSNNFMDKPHDLAVSVNFCSTSCQKMCFSYHC